MAVETPYSPYARAERLIAIGRMILAAASLVGTFLQTQPGSAAFTVRAVLIIYAVYATVFAALTWSSPVAALQRRLAVHTLDVIVFSVLMVFSRETHSAFLLYFLLIVLCASLRFARRGILITAAAAIAVYLVSSLPELLELTRREDLVEVIVRTVYLVAAAALVYLMGGYQEELNNELMRARSWPRGVPQNVFDLAEQIVRHAARVFHTDHVIMCWAEEEEPWLHVATLEGNRFDVVREPPTTYHPLVDPALEESSFLALDLDSAQPLVIQRERGNFAETRARPIHHELQRRYAMHNVLSPCLPTETVECRLFIRNLPGPTSDALLLAEVVAEILAVRIDQFHVLSEKQRSDRNEERLRLYRDLHDGLLQSMNGVFLHLENVYALIGENPAEARKRLTQAQALVLADQRELREFIEKLRPQSWKGYRRSELEPRLIGLAERFQREWGMRVDVEVELSQPLPPSLSNEVFALANEALSNAAKHAHASRVRLNLHNEDGQIDMSFRYDGLSFPFRGRYDLAALNDMDAGPVTLRERIAWLRGELAIESREDNTVLDVSLPLQPVGEAD
jgi:signal transduction histidine kinase